MKNHPVFIKIKKYILYLSIPLVLWNIELVTQYTKNALISWYDTILPSQFVSIVLLNLVKELSFVRINENPYLYRIKLIVCGFFFGFPAGALIVSSAYQRKMITKAEATILLPVCNMFGPAYLSGFVYENYHSSFEPYFNKSQFFLVLYCVPLLYALTAFFIKTLYQLIKKSQNAINCITNSNETIRNNASQHSFQDIITASLVTISKLLGYMMFFSSLQFILDLIPNFNIRYPYAKAFFEINSSLEICGALFPPYSVFFLIFGCFSGIAQTSCILAKIKLSIFPYILQKIILGITAYLVLSLL